MGIDFGIRRPALPADVRAASAQHRTAALADFRHQATTDWLPPLERGLRSIGRPELATLLLGVIRGLLMDLDATSDTTRTDWAFQDFLDMIEN